MTYPDESLQGKSDNSGHPIRLIINADDLGLTPGVTDGILQAHIHGIVTSASALMNTTHIQIDLPRTRNECPNLGIGVHLTLTDGQPLLPGEKVRSLVDENGRFFKLNHEPERIQRINFDEVRAEWRTQIESFMDHGLTPDHLDSHHHISYYQPEVFNVMLELAHEFSLPVRYPPQIFLERLGQRKVNHRLQEYGVVSPADCITTFYGPNNAVSRENLIGIIDSLGNGTHEVMCHPGVADQDLLNNSSYSKPRELELEILTDPELIQLMETNCIKRIRFSDL